MNNIALVCALCVAVQDAPPTGGDADPILSGPDVRDVDDARPSLVGGDFGGAMSMVRADPALDALRLIELGDEQNAALERIMADRWSQLDELVRSNYGLIIEFSAAATAGNQQELIAILPRVQETFKSFTDRGTVIEEMSPHLRKDQIAEAQRLLTEYVEARVDEFAAANPNLPRLAHVRRAQLEAFGRQIAESVERQIGLQQDQYAQFAEELVLTPEQMQKIEAIYQPIAIERFQGKVDQRAEAAAMFQVWEILTPEQRTKFLQLQYGGSGQDAEPDDDATAAEPQPYKMTPGPFEVESQLIEWRDEERNRNVPARLYVPRLSGIAAGRPLPHPVIIFSHGLGGTRDGGSYLGEHWASHGYVCVHLEHVGSNATVARDQGLVRTLNRMPRQQDEWRNRAKDVSFAVDQLEQLNSDDSNALFEKLDLEHVGVAGHSYGAYTSMAVIGALIDFPGQPDVSLRDPRIKASMPMSPQWAGRLGLDEDSWKAIEAPVLYMTGTNDTGAGGVDASRRMEPFQFGTGDDQYLMVIQDAYHHSFGDVREQNRLRERQRDPRHHDWIRMTGTAFFDAYLQGDAEAKEWLRARTIVNLSGDECKFEHR